MYASLIGAGVSQLYDLLKGQTQTSDSTFGVSDPSTTSSTSKTSKSGSATSSFSTDLNQLFVDLQAGSSSSTSSTSTASATTDPTTTVPNDLQNISSDLRKTGAGRGHHHGSGGAPGAAQTAAQSTSSSDPTSASSSSNPFQSLASSLLAYANTQGLTSTRTASTSLTA